MKKSDSTKIKIICSSILAVLTLGSGFFTFHHLQSSAQSTDSTPEYNDNSIPPPVVVTKTDMPANVSPTDIPSPSDLQPPVPTEPQQPTEETIKVKIVKVVKATNIRAEDKSNSEKLSVLTAGTEVEYISESNSRYQVKYAGNKSGWVVKSCCEVYEKEITIKHIPSYIAGPPIDMKGTKEGDGLGSIFKNYGTMGASVAVIQNGQVAYLYEYGYANKEKKLLVTEDTKFRIASVTKVFTSMMAMAQVDDGLLDLDKDLSDILGFKVRHPSYSKQPITTRMLLTHSAGLVDRSGMYTGNIKKTLSSRDHYSSKPGTAFLYSNLSMGTAGAVLETTSKQVIAEYARDRFFQPMGLDASFDAKYLSDKSLVADCYAGGKIDCSNRYLTRSQPTGGPGKTYHLTAGGLLISSKDLASLFTILLNDGQYNGKQYISHDSLEQMLTKQIETKKAFEQCIGIRKMENLVGDRDMYYHNGAAYGIYSLMALDMSDKTGVIVITSGAGAHRNENTVFAVCDDVLNYCYSDIIK